MFDLFRSRQKAVRYILGALLLMVGLSMVITLIPGYGSTTSSSNDDSVLADIGNQKLTVQEVDRTIQAWVHNGQIQPALLDVYAPQFINQMIRERAAIYEFQSKGLNITDDEILVGLASSYAQFFQTASWRKTSSRLPWPSRGRPCKTRSTRYATNCICAKSRTLFTLQPS